jgi:hypothetical protein
VHNSRASNKSLFQLHFLNVSTKPTSQLCRFSSRLWQFGHRPNGMFKRGVGRIASPLCSAYGFSFWPWPRSFRRPGRRAERVGVVEASASGSADRCRYGAARSCPVAAITMQTNNPKWIATRNPDVIDKP